MKWFFREKDSAIFFRCRELDLSELDDFSIKKDHKMWYSISMSNQNMQGIGIAFDLGTTTLVGYLCSLEKKEVIDTFSCTNPQVKYGKDVISRVTYMSKGLEYKKEVGNILARSIIEISDSLLKHMVSDLAEGASVEKGEVPLLLVGNPVIMGSISFVDFDEDGYTAIRIPNIGDYVGADALSVMTMVDGYRKKNESVLMIDIGTNTEMALMTDEGNVATSAAAGPAFEGGNIECGMSAQPGAIDYVGLTNGVNVNSDIMLHAIDSVTPVGICGSGLLSVISLLRRVGLIDESGYMLSKEEALKENIPRKIAARIETITGDINGNHATKYSRMFKLTDTVFVSLEDVRNVQLAKSAIRSGIEILLDKKKLTISVIDRIYLAGAFGNKIKVEDILDIGMIPEVDVDRIVQSGNLAGLGACEMLLNSGLITRAIDIKNSTLTVSLDREKGFQNEFMKYMSF